LFPPRDAGAYPFVFQRISEPVGVVTSVSEQPFDLWLTAQQCPCADIVTNLPGGDEEVERSSLAVANGVEFGVHTTFGLANQATAPPFLAVMLVAVQCAFRQVASIITVFCSPCSAASPTIIRENMPFSLQRFHRL